MKNIPAFLILTYILCLTSCDFGREFETDFESYVSKSDSIFDDSDPFHPTLTYFKNGKILGIEFDAHPSCGNYNRKYFIKNDSVIDKIIIRKKFFTGDCDKFDSIFVIKPLKKTIQTYTENEKGKFIKNENLIQRMLIDLKNYKAKNHSTSSK